jgi:hypothetical protein
MIGLNGFYLLDFFFFFFSFIYFILLSVLPRLLTASHHVSRSTYKLSIVQLFIIGNPTSNQLTTNQRYIILIVGRPLGWLSAVAAVGFLFVDTVG